MLSLTNASQFGYTQYTYTVTAADSASTLEFSAANPPYQWDLDNISLVDPSSSSSGTGSSSGTSSSGGTGSTTSSGNLVTNGSFETGDFSDWTVGGDSATLNTGPQLFVDNTAESGTHAAAFGSMGGDGTLSQTIATTPGETYTLSFWLENETAGSDMNDFKAMWDGQTLLSLTNATQFGYTEYT